MRRHNQRRPAIGDPQRPATPPASLPAGHGRDHVQPEDLQAVLPGVVGHRLQVVADYGASSKTDPVTQLLEAVPIPR